MSKLRGLQQFLYPPHPLNPRFLPRMKRGLMNYAQVSSWWGVTPLQKLISARHFTFAWASESARFQVKFPAGDPTQIWALSEIFECGNYDLDRVPFEPDVVLDLGANIGLFALLVARRWPQSMLICVEPHPTTFSLLCENLKSNGVTASKLQCAASKLVSIQYMSDKGAAISEQLIAEGDARTRTLTLPLHSLIPRTPNLKLLIKIDVEGAEFDVLSAVEGHLPDECFVFVEVHEGDSSVERMRRWAQSNGFEYAEGRRAGNAVDGRLQRVR